MQKREQNRTYYTRHRLGTLVFEAPIKGKERHV